MRGPNTLGNFLRSKRKELGLTIAELGKEMGLSASTISHVETGQFSSPTLYTLKLFGAVYNMKPVELMKMIDVPNHSAKEYMMNHD